LPPDLALIGAGYWGKNLARNFLQLGCLHTICDANPSILAGYGSEYSGVARVTTVTDVFSNKGIAKVAIAAPAALHYRLTKEALLAGKDVFVEKPLCLELAEAEELVALAVASGRILMVGHLLQYHPYVRRLQEIVHSGDLGKLQYVSSTRLNLGKIRREENALWSFAPHDISVILSLVDNRLPEQIRCTGEAFLSAGVADTTMTTMRFAGQVRAHVHVSWLNPFKEQKLSVVGSSGMAVFDDTLPWAQKLVVYTKPLTWVDGHEPVPNKKAPESVVLPELEPLREECLQFLDSCRTRVAPRTDGAEGLRVLRVLRAAQDSLERDGEAVTPAAIPGRTYYAHPTAVIDSGCAIGSGVKIWHFSHLMQGCEIGDGCNLGQNVVISPDVKLGRNVKIQNNVSVYTGVVCEDDVFLGPSMVFTNVTNPRSSIVRRGEYKKTIVRKGVTIGANATIVCGHELGEYCFVGAGAVVTKDVKPYALVVGNPARQVGWMSRFGKKLTLPLIGDGETVCPDSGLLYRVKNGSCLVEEARS
jgi:UDP-2-acetamido-3-amino-2,3-dideoxy-glucuronate N-acetyltransferase